MPTDRSNVLPFPAEPNLDRQAAAKLRIAEEVRERAQKSRLLTPGQMRVVGANLDRLLEQAKGRGIKMNDVVATAFPTHAIRDQSRLHKYRPHKRPPNKSFGGYNKSFRGYVDLALAVAKLAGMDETDILVQLQDGVPGLLKEFNVDDPEQQAIHDTARLLRAGVNAVIARTGMHEFARITIDQMIISDGGGGWHTDYHGSEPGLGSDDEIFGMEPSIQLWDQDLPDHKPFKVLVRNHENEEWRETSVNIVQRVDLCITRDFVMKKAVPALRFLNVVHLDGKIYSDKNNDTISFIYSTDITNQICSEKGVPIGFGRNNNRLLIHIDHADLIRCRPLGDLEYVRLDDHKLYNHLSKTNFKKCYEYRYRNSWLGDAAGGFATTPSLAPPGSVAAALDQALRGQVSSVLPPDGLDVAALAELGWPCTFWGPLEELFCETFSLVTGFDKWWQKEKFRIKQETEALIADFHERQRSM